MHRSLSVEFLVFLYPINNIYHPPSRSRCDRVENFRPTVAEQLQSIRIV